MDEIVYKILTREQWAEAERAGVFRGAPVDLADGYIHFSTVAQVRETAARHFGGRTDLLLLAVATRPIVKALRYEPSRGGELFPHLYADLPLSAVLRVEDLPLDRSGSHRFPNDELN